MPDYLPFAGKNAIVEMVAGFQFQGQFYASLGPTISALRQDFEKDLPKFEPVQQITFTMGPAASMPAISPPPSPAGFVFTKPKQDGTPGRILRAIGNTVSIHFMEYDRWEDTSESILDYSRRCLTLMNVVERNGIVATFLRYIDRFTFDGNPDDAKPAALFRERTNFLPSVIFGSGNQWHANSGWYEPLAGLRTFNNLNVGAVAQNPATVTVDHSNVYPLETICHSVAEFIDGAPSRPSVLKVWDEQHSLNKRILANLLNQKTLDTIGLRQ